VIHHAVQSVVEVLRSIQDVDGLDAAVHCVGVERFKDKHADATILALIALPISSGLAGGPSRANIATDVGIVGDDLEVSIFLTWLSCAGVRGGREGEKDIVRSRAGELSTVFNDGPLVGRVIEECHRCCVHILKLDVG
jgi:hypothetical protein